MRKRVSEIERERGKEREGEREREKKNVPKTSCRKSVFVSRCLWDSLHAHTYTNAHVGSEREKHVEVNESTAQG